MKKKYILFIYIILTSFIAADLANINLASIGNFNIYVNDIFYSLFIISFIYVLINLKKVKSLKINNMYLLLIFILIISIFYGMLNFGFRAIGEGRYIYGLFAFFVPFSIFAKDEYTSSDVIKFVKTLIYISALASLILFVIELINGGRFFFSEANYKIIGLTDFRGTRYLGSEETYNIMILAISLFFANIYEKNKNYTQILVSVVLFVIVIYTKNRTAPIALFAGMIMTLIITDKKIVITYVFGLLIAVYLGLNFFSSETLEKILLAFNILDIKGDQTGSWRYYVQYSALTQGLNTPIFGEGFGGYFKLYVPEWGKIIELPPHNIFVYLFLKSGLIGVFSSIAMLISLIYALFKNRQFWFISYNKAYYLLFQTIIISQFFYGLAYGFSLYFGLFAGFATLINYKLRYENIKSKRLE